MSKKLEDFIQNNRDAFDSYQPSDALWQRIEKKLDAPENEKKAKVFLIKSWMKIAAAVVVILTTATIFYTLNKGGTTMPEPVIAGNDGSDHLDSSAPGSTPSLAINSDTPMRHPGIADSKKGMDERPAPAVKEEEELYHYTRLIEIKQEQMQALKKNEPELYKEFSKDIEMLETSYDALKAQLETGINSEKLLEAMIGNLKMQTDLLNTQLNILKQVHRKNNKQNEKDYKSL
ncbi:MAG TPA: anti-sigma factor [Niabella sp.]|nr:anti-sigma factor [Niabella sp.]